MIVVGSMDEILIRSSPSICFQLCDQPDQIEFALAILPDVDAGQHNFPDNLLPQGSRLPGSRHPGGDFAHARARRG